MKRSRFTIAIIVGLACVVIALGGTLDYLVGNVFNYPTLAECYKVAALDAFNKLSERELHEATEGRAAA